MTIDRRSVIKGMVFGGLSAPLFARTATALAMPHDASRDANGSTVLLVAEGATDSAFVHGARAGIGAAGLTVLEASRELAFVLGFENALRNGRSLRVAGLLDDALATLLLDQARRAGARVPWIGQHGCDGSGLRHHYLSDTPISGRLAAQWSSRLHDDVAGFSPGDGSRGHIAPARGIATRALPAEHADEWAAMLGYGLASLDRRDIYRAPAVQADRTPLTGSFVSFLIES